MVETYPYEALSVCGHNTAHSFNKPISRFQKQCFCLMLRCMHEGLSTQPQNCLLRSPRSQDAVLAWCTDTDMCHHMRAARSSGVAAGACGSVRGDPWARVGGRAGGRGHGGLLPAAAAGHSHGDRAPRRPHVVDAVEAAALTVCGAPPHRPPGLQFESWVGLPFFWFRQPSTGTVILHHGGHSLGLTLVIFAATYSCRLFMPRSHGEY